MVEDARSSTVEELETQVVRWRRTTLLALVVAAGSLGVSLWTMLRRPGKLRLADDKVETVITPTGIVNRSLDGKTSARLSGLGVELAAGGGAQTMRIDAFGGLDYRNGPARAGITTGAVVATNGTKRAFLDGNLGEVGVASGQLTGTVEPTALRLGSAAGPAFDVTLGQDPAHPFSSMALRSRLENGDQIHAFAGETFANLGVRSPGGERTAVLQASDTTSVEVHDRGAQRMLAPR